MIVSCGSNIIRKHLLLIKNRSKILRSSCRLFSAQKSAEKTTIFWERESVLVDSIIKGRLLTELHRYKVEG